MSVCLKFVPESVVRLHFGFTRGRLEHSLIVDGQEHGCIGGGFEHNLIGGGHELLHVSHTVLLGQGAHVLSPNLRAMKNNITLLYFKTQVDEGFGHAIFYVTS